MIQQASKSNSLYFLIDEKIIDASFKCNICMNIYKNPICLAPCCHTFCNACICKWREQHNTCPICRTVIVNATKNTAIDNLMHGLENTDVEYIQKKRENSSQNSTGENNILAKKAEVSWKPTQKKQQKLIYQESEVLCQEYSQMYSAADDLQQEKHHKFQLQQQQLQQKNQQLQQQELSNSQKKRMQRHGFYQISQGWDWKRQICSNQEVKFVTPNNMFVKSKSTSAEQLQIFQDNDVQMFNEYDY